MRVISGTGSRQIANIEATSSRDGAGETAGGAYRSASGSERGLRRG